jgi:cystathionine beta-lyase family protein involved in aluminum resistance
VTALSGRESYLELLERLEAAAAPCLSAAEKVALINQARVLDAFRALRVDEYCFADSTGYGYHDLGREKLDGLYAAVFGGESALVRPQFVSGTHAISACLYAILSPGDRLVSLTGKPYDTLHRAMGCAEALPGSLAALGVSYAQADCSAGWEGAVLDSVLAEDTRLVFIQRSRGYAERPALTAGRITDLVREVKVRRPEAVILVDNCYGEFVQVVEPCHLGADLVAGSLIKNPGGGLAPTGGYVAGRSDLVERVAWRLTAPGLGAGIGSMAGVKRNYYQGLFLAPHLVAQAKKGAILAAALFFALGYDVSPLPREERGDIVQAVRLGSPELLLKFCRAVQAASPVDSHLTPEAAPMVGYSDHIVMAAGTFIQGAGSEFTADAPLRPPYTVFIQGGLTYAHVKLALAEVLSALDIAPQAVLDSFASLKI